MAMFTVPMDFPLTVLNRLTEAGVPAADRHTALATLTVIMAQLGVQTFTCRASVLDLAS